MKILFYAMALYSAFFVSLTLANTGAPPNFPPDYEWPGVAPESKKMYVLRCRMSHLTTENEFKSPSPAEAAEQCMSYARSFFPSDGCSYWPYRQISLDQSSSGNVSFGYSQPDGVPSCKGANSVNWHWLSPQNSDLACPPDDFPLHQLPWLGTDGTISSCHKKKDNPEPDPEEDTGCDEFGNNSFLPPNESLNVPAGGSVCFTTSGGSKCSFKKNPFGSGYEQTGKECTGEETPYPNPDLTPPDNPDNPNACATVGSVDPYAVCPINPNDVCNRIIVKGDAGEKLMNQCPAGCGSVNGQFVCAYPDSNGDGIPDKNQDPEKGSDTKDPNDPNNPNNDSPDSTKANTLLYGIDQKLGVGNSRLTGIKNGIEGMTKEQMKGNASLSAIASNTAKTANNTLSTAGSTADILTTLTETNVSNTFNPESSASFYESEYENGFAGVWEEKSSEFQQTEAYQFLQQFKFNGGGAAPDTSMCFNLGQFMDFGCSELPVPDAGLLAILKVFILISAAFLCRRLIFGG